MQVSDQGYRMMIVGLNMVYTEACDRKDYQTCDKVRIELQRLLSGKKLLIKIEDGLHLSNDPMTILSS